MVGTSLACRSVRRRGPDLKWGTVKHHWRDLSADLRAAVLRDLRDALIIIIDPSIYRFELEQPIESAVRQPRRSWPKHFRAWVDEHALQSERESILSASPASLIQDYLEDDGEILGGVGSVGCQHRKFGNILTIMGNPCQ
jgi:hypothetical protein